ncbi:MAG: quinolinate synthase NadA, partial [Bacteroidales bacterium]|nr:quinolinate synthase NadA [Bacteroidales bacterium]
MEERIIERILKLKKEKNAIILAHFYQIPQIQDIADFVGDSLNLAEKARTAKEDLILFCGVHFMGETAKILNPNKKVIIPDLNAGCSLADSCKYEDFKAFKEQYPEHIVISYINCSAEIKTLSDIICTSGNAVQLVNSLPKDQKIIFAPDKNLGGYINRISGRDMVLWDGTCEVHELLTSEYVLLTKKSNPDAILVAHPECNDAVLQLADFVGSTSAMINYIKKSDNKKFLVATESGIVHQLKKDNPEKEFIVVTQDESCSCNDCQYMKLNTLEKVL